MPLGYPRPIVLILFGLGLLPGCSAFPIPRGSSGPATPTPGATIQRPEGVLKVPDRIDPQFKSESTLPELPLEPAEPTPLLDEALVRAKATQLQVFDEIAVPELPVPALLPEEKRESIPVEPPKPPPTPAELWRESLETLRGLARQRPADQPSSTWSARAAWLDWIGRIGADPEADRLGSTLIAALPNDSGDITHRSDRIREAVTALEDRAPLEISEIQLCQKVLGFGDFESLGLDTIKPGQPVILYWEVNGLRHEAVENGFRTRLAAQVEVVPQAGGAAILSQTLSPVEDRCRKRRRDYYVNSRVDLPATLPSGAYELRLTQTDTIAGRSSSRILVFRVKP